MDNRRIMRRLPEADVSRPPNNYQNAPSFIRREFSIFQLDQADLAAGATAQTNIPIQADAAFELSKLAQITDLNGAAITESARIVPLVTIQITDTSSGLIMFSDPVPLGALFGYGGLPFILPEKRIFAANSNISVTLVNYSAATAYDLRLSFIGTKLFGYRG